MLDKPKCFSYALSTNDWVKKNLGIDKLENCDECELLEDCIRAYNARVYDEWVEDYYLMDEKDFEYEKMEEEELHRQLEEERCSEGPFWEEVS